jgi:hypothetical protein
MRKSKVFCLFFFFNFFLRPGASAAIKLYSISTKVNRKNFKDAFWQLLEEQTKARAQNNKPDRY